MSDQIKKAKKLDRIDHVDATIKRKGCGDFSMVPNCIYKIGLSRLERDLWCYLHSLPSWENPVVNDLVNILVVGKAQLLNALEKLEQMNMIATEGKGKARIFHLSSPAYWDHPLPRSLYAFGKDEKKPVDIGNGLFGVSAVNRTGENRSKQNEKNRSKQNEKENRSKQNEKPFQTERKTVLNRTKRNQQTVGAVSGKASLKTLQDSQDSLNLKPRVHEEGQTSLPVGGITKSSLIGELASLYVGTVKKDVLEAVIVAMQRKASREKILEVIEAQRAQQQGLRKWGLSDKAWWLSKLDPDYQAQESMPAPKTDWARVDQQVIEEQQARIRLGMSLDLATMPH